MFAKVSAWTLVPKGASDHFFLQIILLFAVACCCEAGGYGGSSGGGYSSGKGGYSGSSSGGYSGSSSSYGGSSYGGGKVSQNTGPVQAAVRSRHTIEYVDVDLPQDDIQPQIVDVDAGVLPLVLNFKSASSRIQVHQSHEGAEAGEIQETQSEDEPQLLRHEVTKPIIQEVREIITPYRRVVQEIRPVEEEVKTIVSRGKGRRQNNADYSGKTGGGYSGSRSSGSGYSSGGSYGSSSFAGSQSKSY